MNASGSCSQNPGRAMRRTAVIPSLRQQPRRDIRLGTVGRAGHDLPRAHVRLPRLAAVPLREGSPLDRVLVARPRPSADVAAEVRVTLLHESPMIPAGPSQLPKHQLDVPERLAVLGHSLCSIRRDPAVTSVPRPCLQQPLALLRCSVTRCLVTISTPLRVDEVRVARPPRRARPRAHVAGCLEGTAKLEGSLS